MFSVKMKPVQFFTTVGILVLLGSSRRPCLAAKAACGLHSTCVLVDACLKMHDGGENLSSSLLFPCGSTKVCCPSAEDSAKKIKSRISSMKLFDTETCGRDTAERIKNGQEALSGQFPWMVLLGYEVKNDPSKIDFACGGTLITKLFILTAAHCLPASGPKLKLAYLGELDQRTDPDCLSVTDTGEMECFPKVVVRKIVRSMVHERYSRHEQLKNDIALLKMDQPIVFSDTVLPICLPFNRSIIGDNVKLRVSGWGKLDADKPASSSTLMWAYVTSISHEDCNLVLTGNTRKILRSQMCAAGANGEDACRGDSGGPLIFLDQNTSSTELVGIVSFGVGKCGRQNSPTVYTRVSSFTDWILDTMDRMR